MEYVDDLAKNLHSLSPSERADCIYSHVGSFRYGIEEAVLSGTRFRYPHQIKEQLTCGEAGVYVYMLAKAAGLKPRLFRLVELDGMPSDHLYVDVDTGRRESLDPLMQLRGPVRYILRGIVVQNGERSEKYTRFREIEALDEDDAADFMYHINSQDGIPDYLAARQKLGEDKGDFGVMEQYASISPEGILQINNVLHGLPPWTAVNSYNANRLTVRTRFGMKYNWGDVEDPFFESEAYLLADDRRNTFHSENASKQMRHDASKILIYHAVIGIEKDVGEGDGIYLRPVEDTERIMEGIERGDFGVKGDADKFSEQMRRLRNSNPDFYRRYADFRAYSLLEYSNKKELRRVMRLLKGMGISTAEQMLATYMDRYYAPRLLKEWSKYVFSNKTIPVLEAWVEEATGIKPPPSIDGYYIESLRKALPLFPEMMTF